MADENVLKIFAIVSLTVIEGLAIWKEIDGKVLLIIGTLIGGIIARKIK